MYVSGNLGGRGISQAYDGVRTHAMIDVATDRVAVLLSFGCRNLIYLSASRVPPTFLFIFLYVLRGFIDISVHVIFVDVLNSFWSLLMEYWNIFRKYFKLRINLSTQTTTKAPLTKPR